MRSVFRFIALTVFLFALGSGPSLAQSRAEQFRANELVDTGHRFFGGV